MPGAVSLGGWGPILSPNPANVPGTFPLKERVELLLLPSLTWRERRETERERTERERERETSGHRKNRKTTGHLIIQALIRRSHDVAVGGPPQEARTTWAAISRFFNPSISLSNGVPFLELAKKRGPPV